MDCIFCKIISGEIPSEKVYESDKVIAFKDINPMAPVHILIIPKEHIEGADKLDESNVSVVKDIMLVAKHLAKSFNLDNGWRLVSNRRRRRTDCTSPSFPSTWRQKAER